MGKREDNKLAKELESEIIGGIKDRLKGSGWKKKHNSFFQSVDNQFLCASAYPYFEFKNSVPSLLLRVRYEAKPMGIDPIYWDIAQMPENKKEPLSFRAWAAFKARPAYFHLATTIGNPKKTSEEVIDLFLEWIKSETMRVSKLLEKSPFSEVYQNLEPEKSQNENDAITLICSYILEGRNDKALAIARKLAPNSYQNLFYKKPKNRVNFFELTILHLAGKRAFKEEIKKKSNLEFIKRKIRNLL